MTNYHLSSKTLLKSRSHSGLQPKGDYDHPTTERGIETPFDCPIADFSRKAIMTVFCTLCSADLVGCPIADFSRKAIMTTVTTPFTQLPVKVSHSGLQPKGDYDLKETELVFELNHGPIADFSRKAIMT